MFDNVASSLMQFIHSRKMLINKVFNHTSYLIHLFFMVKFIPWFIFIFTCNKRDCKIFRVKKDILTTKLNDLLINISTQLVR